MGAGDAPLSDVWVVQASCGDYYCEWDHLLGVYASEEQAEMARGVAVVAEYVYRSHAEPRRRFSAWDHVRINKFELDRLPEALSIK